MPAAAVLRQTRNALRRRAPAALGERAARLRQQLKPSHPRLLGLSDSYAQHGQDVFVRDVLCRRSSGYFVDVGARCGRKISNSLLLDETGWSGICIEPHPDLYRELASNRPRSTNLNIGASSSPGELQFLQRMTEPRGHSRIVGADEPVPEGRAGRDYVLSQIDVEPLDSVLRRVGAPAHIDYLDIDVEGHELQVLKGIDFDRSTFTAIGVEGTPGGAAFGAIAAHLEIAGYEAVAVLGSDTFFVAADR